MGLADSTIELILNYYNKGYFKNYESVIELGSQDLKFEPRDKLLNLLSRKLDFDKKYLEQVFSEALKKSTPDDFSPEWVFKLLGFKGYCCIDADGRHNAFIWDLNAPIPEDQIGKYDLITNYGTSEHVFNVLQIFKNIHDLAHTGSIMIHELPFQGYIDHGFYNYQPSFFEDLAFENKYEIIEKYVITCVPEDLTSTSEIVPFSKDALIEIYKKNLNAGLHYALRKVKSDDFRIPFHGKYDPLLLLNYRNSFLQKISQIIAVTFFKSPKSAARRIYKIIKNTFTKSTDAC